MSALDAGERSASRSRTPGNHRVWSWVGPGAGLPEIEPWFLGRQTHSASLYRQSSRNCSLVNQAIHATAGSILVILWSSVASSERKVTKRLSVRPSRVSPLRSEVQEIVKTKSCSLWRENLKEIVGFVCTWGRPISLPLRVISAVTKALASTMTVSS
jgi:hypothetical protein